VGAMGVILLSWLLNYFLIPQINKKSGQ